MNEQKPEMDGEEIVNIYTHLEKMGIQIWVDGGWAVDALLGKQTRSHTDLDIAIQYKDLDKFREWMEDRGYKEVPRDDDKKWNFVLGDSQGREVDVHAFDFDEKGNGIYGPVENGDMYSASSLSGNGTINGQPVRCINAESMIEFIKPWLYKKREKNFHDIKALCEKFGLALPEEYLKNR